MSFCSPTIGSGRPSTFGSNSAACSSFSRILHCTEQIPKTQSRSTPAEIDPNLHTATRTRACEEVGVARIARDADRMERGDAAEHQRALRSRHSVRARDVLDVAHRPATANREIEERRSNSRAEDTALERAAAMMRDVEDRLVDDGLHREP